MGYDKAMRVSLKKLQETLVELTIVASEPSLLPYKNQVLAKLAGQVKVAGFRAGKAPASLVEKHVDPSALQSEFLDTALSALYAKAVESEGIRPMTRPDVAIKKFVPFTALEFTITVHVIEPIKLPKYKGLQAKKTPVLVSEKDINDILESLKVRVAEKQPVKRAAKTGDEVVIDFKGVDAKKQPVSGAEGKDYALVLGSNSFIPGFEDNVVGMKSGQQKTFTLTFPKDYGVKALASKKVTFAVTASKVQEVQAPKLDDAFAAKIGPFKSLKELKDDIKKQVGLEKTSEAERQFQNELVKQVVDKTTIVIPQPLIEQQAEHNLESLKRELTYRGQTYEEFLKSENTTEAKYTKEVLRPQAEQQIKTGLTISQIAEAEKLQVTPDELDRQIQLLKGQYKDQAMQAELDKPDNRSDIASRILSEKVVTLLAGSAV